MIALDPRATPAERQEAVQRIAREIDGRIHVGGRWSTPRCTERRVAVDPSTAESLGEFACCGPDDVDDAVQAAKRAQRAWAACSLADRAERFMLLHDVLAGAAETLAVCDAVDAGLPLQAMRGEAVAAAETIRQWPGLALAATGQVFDRADGRLHYTTFAPYGVVARIIAYNHPTYAAVAAIAPALLAGNALVLKPSDHTPISALVLAELASRVLPPGLVNVITGDARAAQALVTHPDVRRIAFTGGTPTGLVVQREAAGQVRHVTLELSGKNAMLVRSDAVLDDVADGVVRGMNLRTNQGQSCASTSRIYVDRRVHDELVERVAARFAALRVDVAYDDRCEVGPMISANHAASVRANVDSAVEQGARALPEDARSPANGGFFVAPTVLTGVEHGAPAAREEIFGPVATFLPWDDEEEALDRVNDSRYALSASVWTRDIDQGLALVQDVEAGYVWLNTAGEFPWATPFGGWKDSGLGQQECLEELRSYQQCKTVHVRLRA